MKEYISLFLKGIGIGAANVIPGVSGGTIALEIHHMDENKAINSIIETNLFSVKEKKEHLVILQKTPK